MMDAFLSLLFQVYVYLKSARSLAAGFVERRTSLMTSTRHVIALIFAVLSVSLADRASGQAAPSVSEYRGTCDASAAVSMGNGHFIVANDEDNLLRVYRFISPDPVRTYDLDSFAKADPDKPEMDIEGAAKVGSRIYWITSHGANRNAKYRPGRRRFLATDIGFKDGRPEVTPVGHAYADLLDDLIESAQLKKYSLGAAAEIAPKDEGGLNIEGLAATPGGALLIGFRNPIPGGNALIVTINNPSDVIQGKIPVIGPVVELPLGGLGIRSIERNGESYLIVAGPHSGKGDFRLFRWQGPLGTAKLTPVPAPKFEDLNPEALFVSSKGRVVILSDDGGKKIDGVDCKDLPVEEQRFRARTISP